MAGAQILGMGMAVPKQVVTNHDLEQRLETTDEWIRQRTGIRQRHIAGEGETPATLAVEAGHKALEQAEMSAEDLDLVVVGTCSPDYHIPGTAPSVQAGLGAVNAGAFDINAACAGFVYGLSYATGLITSGLARHILVCGAETMSRVTNQEDRGTAVVFGDGAGAAVVGPTKGESRIGPFVYGCDGSKVPMLLIPGGGSAEPSTPENVAEARNKLHMQGQPTYRITIERMVEAARKLLGDEPLENVDMVIPHQANERIVRAVADRLKLEERQLLCNVANYGNTSAATIPIALAEASADGRIKPDMRLMLCTIGAGFTWIAGWLRWGTED